MKDAREERLRALFEAGPFTRPSIVPGGYPAQLFEPLDVPGLGRFLTFGAEQLYRIHGGSLPTTAYIFGRRSPWVAEPLEADVLLTTSLKRGYGEGGDHIRDAFAMLIQGTAATSKARAVAILMEAWLLVRPADGSPLPTGSIEHEPDRREILMVSLETATARQCWHSNITRHADRGVALDPFEAMPPNVEFDGRFSGLMP